MGKKLLILGNGFDLAFGFWTSYANFVNVRAGKDYSFWPFNEPPTGKYLTESLHHHFYNFVRQHEDELGRIRWIDIEQELYNYVNSKKGLPVNNELVQEDERSYNSLVYQLQTYLSAVYPHRRNHDIDITIPTEILKAIRRNGGFNLIYTFNYTNPTYIFSNFAGYSENEMPPIKYMHGSLNDKNIVLGFNEDLNLPQEYDFMFKCDKIEPHNLANDLLDADDIIVYGLSFGKIDGIYFKPFLEQLSSVITAKRKPRFSIITYDENSVKSIRRNLRAMGLSREKINNGLEFRIIPVHEIEWDATARNNYNSFLENLKPMPSIIVGRNPRNKCEW